MSSKLEAVQLSTTNLITVGSYAFNFLMQNLGEAQKLEAMLAAYKAAAPAAVTKVAAAIPIEQELAVIYDSFVAGLPAGTTVSTCPQCSPEELEKCVKAAAGTHPILAALAQYLPVILQILSSILVKTTPVSVLDVSCK